MLCCKEKPPPPASFHCNKLDVHTHLLSLCMSVWDSHGVTVQSESQLCPAVFTSAHGGSSWWEFTNGHNIKGRWGRWSLSGYRKVG